MTVVTRALREHVTAGILDAAATVLAEHGDAASMPDIAKAAGVSRSTLYRYFPSRESLVRALVDAALADLSGKVADANLDAVPVEEALARLTRAAMAVFGKYRALALFEQRFTKPGNEDEGGAGPLVAELRALFERGTADGTLRTDLSLPTLLAAYTGLLRGIGSLVIRGERGVEEASAAITTMFLAGARHDG